jgi:hypothetical protein
LCVCRVEIRNELNKYALHLDKVYSYLDRCGAIKANIRNFKLFDMNGFNPLGDFKNWHFVAIAVLTIIGCIALIFSFIYAIIWMFNHVQII